MSLTRLVAHTRKTPARCRIPCTLHNAGPLRWSLGGRGRLAWPAAWVDVSASCSRWRSCRSRCGPPSRSSPRATARSRSSARSSASARRSSRSRGRERVLTSDISAVHEPDRQPPGRHHGAADQAGAAADATSTPSAPSWRRSRRICGGSGCGSPACASASRRRACCSPTAWSRCTRPTSPTSSPSCSSPTASPTCSSAPSSCSASRDQDARLIERVRGAKAEATATAARLDKLEKRAAEVAQAIEQEVKQVESVKVELVDRRDSYAAVRSEKAGDAREHARRAATSSRSTSTRSSASRRRSWPGCRAAPRPPPARSSTGPGA